MASKQDPETSVFELLTELCNATALKYAAASGNCARQLSNKMRSHSYEIVLRKTSKELPSNNWSGEPIIDLLSYYFMAQQSSKNVAEYKKTVELKKIISSLRHTNFAEEKDNVNQVLKLLVNLSNTVNDNLASEMFQKPFSFGLLDEMLPKPKQEIFGSPKPYSFYPSYVFDLPYSLKQQYQSYQLDRPKSYTQYSVESFDSKTFLLENKISKSQSPANVMSFLTPLSVASMTTSQRFSETGIFDCPRLTAPRDLMIPTEPSNTNVKVSLMDATSNADVNEVFNASIPKESVDIWEIANQVDKSVPDNIWDVVSTLPPTKDRQLIATSSREMQLWREIYGGSLVNLDIISEKQFIRHIMYLLIGIETSTFPFSQESDCFYMKEDLILEGISKESVRGYASALLVIGTYYRRLYNFAFTQSLENLHSNGLVYEASTEVIRRFLLEFRLLATEIYKECSQNNEDNTNCMPTLLHILHHTEPMKYEIETVASIFKMIDPDLKQPLPLGANLMSYLFDEISLVTHKKTAHTMFNSLFSICKVYFQFIERFIFEGELDDRFNEFFIRKDTQYVNSRTKRYWDKGYHITQSQAIPEFLRALSKFILLCGKSLRLLKMCNPSDPLVLLISSDHPSVKCCSSFEDLERQQQVLDVYRTRCLFVSGEPVTFDQILLKKEAERKAFTEMASIKQAETMEKIIAERKRLAQLIIAEKQHSLRILEAAMAEAKAAKMKSKHRERKIHELEQTAEKASEEVDSILRDSEKNKIMEYYSKLNMAVEKSKIHTEWKIKRLQLDQSRMQLLSTEERNLKREKLEFLHQKNEEMAMSIQSVDTNSEIDAQGDNENVDNRLLESMSESCSSVILTELPPEETEFDQNKTKAQTSSDVFSAICSVAKSFFGGTKSDDKKCDNHQKLDAQGNIIDEVKIDARDNKTSSNVIGSSLNTALDNIEFLKMRQEALVNKQNVMAHELGQTDFENNQVISLPPFDEENNVAFSASTEAKRNKLKVIGDNFGVGKLIEKVDTEPRTVAQKEALINKQKVLGVEYNLPVAVTVKNEPANIAQEEAIINKNRVLSAVKYNQPAEDVAKREPANEAQVEALRNKNKILTAVEYNQPLQHTPRNEPANIAQEEALRNKEKDTGVTYNIPTDFYYKKEALNVAQEEGLRNRSKAQSSDKEYNVSPRRENLKRSGLTLNLKTHNEYVDNSKLGITPNTGAVTPAEFFPRLDLETPTTADVPFDGPQTNDIFATENYTKDFSSKTNDKDLLSESYNYSLLEDQVDAQTELDSPVKPNKITSENPSIFNILDGSYTLENFDPFSVKDLRRYSTNYFTSKMDIDMLTSCYTHPAILMQEVQKKPYTNIFASRCDDEELKINCENIATLTACLQRSVMLPLTYQLEVVNNSILTHFLVNLDMYEHLRSLKDYFFLMDGEFSRSICHNLFTKLVKTLNPQELLNFATLHNILDKALGSSISHVHKFSENLSFTISDTPLSFQHSSPDVLQCLSLTYTVSWPLNIILSNEALVRYAKVFQFLVKMRRIFWVLGEDFESLKLSAKLSKQHSRKFLRSPQYISIQLHRHVMASFLRALDNYIVTTCILTSWTEFENDLKKARTLDDLYECHVVYIKKVLFRCLLNNRSTLVMKLLNDIFTVILKFSRVLKAGEWTRSETNQFSHTNYAQLEELFHLFEKLTKYLHKVITKLMECGYQRHLVELLTMVNLNGYYDPDRSKEQKDSSTQSV